MLCDDDVNLRTIERNSEMIISGVLARLVGIVPTLLRQKTLAICMYDTLILRWDSKAYGLYFRSISIGTQIQPECVIMTGYE